MQVSVIAPRRRPGVTSLDSPAARDRSARRRVGAAWALLYFNTLTYVPGGLLHIPSHVGKAIAQGSLALALLLALTANPKVRLRPNVFLCLVCLLVVDTFISLAAAPHFGETYRTFRLAGYLAALWLLTPWWGRDDMLLLRWQLRCLYVSLGSVLLGLLIAPGKARSFGGRLAGIIWPMAATQVGEYAAVAAGLTIMLWLARRLSGRAALLGATLSIAILLLTHTRTALVSLVAGLLVAGLSLFTVSARVRKFFATGAAMVSIAVITVSGVVVTYLARGQNAGALTSLTGRTTLWALVLNTPRTKFQEIFGFGLSNASVNGLAIDSNWLSGFMQEGLFGVVVCAMMVVWLFVAAFFQPRGVRRSLALFLVTYCTVASFTEDAWTDVSTYLLNLTVAASLIVAPLAGREIFTPSRRPAGDQGTDGETSGPAERAAADLVVDPK
jgi:O-antigen ligase